VKRAPLVVLAVLACAPAWAQSKRYPPEPKDPDREAEQHSKIWEETLEPSRTPYEQLVREAKQLSDGRLATDLQIAIDKLANAIELMPKRPEAFAARGAAELYLKRWSACADDLAAAEDRAPPDETGERWRQRLELGICQARAGHLGEAERTLAGVASAPGVHGEAWLRLGEVRIALGKLDEAIGALHTAIEQDGSHGFAQFLLALAYDRARLPGDAEAAMREGVRFDSLLASIELPMYPLLGNAEAEHLYLMGLAYRYAHTRPEYTLLYFRRFLAIAPDSPWRKRAEEHARELAGLELPQTLEKRGSTAAIDLDAARAAIAKQMPAMRACLAKLPTTALEIEVTRVGPRSPESRDRPRFHVPPPGVAVKESNNVDREHPGPREAIDAAQRCLEPVVAKVAWPAIKETDAWYKLAFLVVAAIP
jgi:tetratricopeptide (TPR) repeat protein